jgi:hypothetical protein
MTQLRDLQIRPLDGGVGSIAVSRSGASELSVRSVTTMRLRASGMIPELNGIEGLGRQTTTPRVHAYTFKPWNLRMGRELAARCPTGRTVRHG